MIFDAIIGNTDRHHSNWAILQDKQNTKICPIYDNGSSLCFCFNENQVKSYLGADKLRFQALVGSKSTSRIRIDRSLKKEPTHTKVLEHIKEKYNTLELEAWIDLVVHNLDSEYINQILMKYRMTFISEDRANLIYKFILEKVKILKLVFFGKEE